MFVWPASGDLYSKNYQMAIFIFFLAKFTENLTNEVLVIIDNKQNWNTAGILHPTKNPNPGIFKPQDFEIESRDLLGAKKSEIFGK